MKNVMAMIVGFTIFLLVTITITKMMVPVYLFQAQSDIKQLSSLTEAGYATKLSDGVYTKNGLKVDVNRNMITSEDSDKLLKWSNTEIVSADLIDFVEIYSNSKVTQIPVRGVYITYEHKMSLNRYTSSTMFFKVGDK